LAWGEAEAEAEAEADNIVRPIADNNTLALMTVTPSYYFKKAPFIKLKPMGV
jgi:hypothetical protein